MDKKETSGISFATNTLDEIPTPSSDAKTITALVKKETASLDISFPMIGS